MNTAVIVDASVQDGHLVIVDEPGYRKRIERAAKKWGNGTALKVRIEPEEDAYTYGDIKHYWGHVVQPFCDDTGYHKHEAHLLFKAECMPEGKTSITELNREELRAYTEAAEQTAREWAPDAFALYDAHASY